MRKLIDMMRSPPTRSQETGKWTCGDCGGECITAQFFDMPVDQVVFVDCPVCHHSDVADMVPVVLPVALQLADAPSQEPESLPERGLAQRSFLEVI